MQVVRYSKECKWITNCSYCGCVFIYKGDEVRDEDVQMSLTVGPEGEPIRKTIKVVICPECHESVRIPRKACDRTGAIVKSTDEEWGDCCETY